VAITVADAATHLLTTAVADATVAADATTIAATTAETAVAAAAD